MLLALAAVSVVTIAAAVGAWQIAIHDARTVPQHGPAAIKLTAAEVEGRKLFATTCATCHTLGAVHAVGRVGPNLDVLQPPAALVLYAIQNGFAIGLGQMPARLYSGKDASDIAQFVAAVAGR
jgi:mono/diheme cytochrome c family protein